MMKLRLPKLSVRLLLAKLANDKRELRRLLPVAFFLVLAALVAVVIFYGNGTNTPPEVEAYHEQLRGQVDTETGAPRSGRDPASQQQTSLAVAASSPYGAGQRVDSPAAGVAGDNSRRNTSSDVYGDPKQTGIGSNGCYIDYGIPGEQCLPAHAATNGILTCEGVTTTTHGGFPNGIKVTGTDRFHLDANHNGIACDSGDF